MKTIIAKKFGLYIQDLAKSTNIEEKLKELKKTQFYNESQLNNYQLKKLKKILISAYENIPFYKKLMDSNYVDPYNIKSLNELKKIPFLTKDLIKNNSLINTKIKNIKYGKTGGTTGVPLKIAKDSNSRSYTWAAYYRWYSWMNIEFGDSVVTLWGAPTVLSKTKKQIVYNNIKNYLANNYVINSFEMNEKNIEEILNKIKKIKPKLIKGYLSSLLEVSTYIIENNIDIFIPNIAPTTETLLPQYRDKLQKAFGGEVYNQYGCGEVTSIAFECSYHNGLHINSEHVILEVVDENGNEIYDKSGEIVVTDLDNFAMPIIRYKNGDIGIMSKNKCKCGVKSDMLTTILGRTIDTIMLKDGTKVHGVFFTDIFHELNFPKEIEKIKRFQCLQLEENEIILKLEIINNLDERFIETLTRELHKFIDNVKIEYFKKIPVEPSGKFRYIKSCLK